MVLTDREQKILDEINQLEAEAQKETTKELQEMKQKGYNFVYTFCVHPCNGDDFTIDIYTNNRLTKQEITKQQNIIAVQNKARLVNIPVLTIL
jgi:hypothetical protein